MNLNVGHRMSNIEAADVWVCRSGIVKLEEVVNKAKAIFVVKKYLSFVYSAI